MLALLLWALMSADHDVEIGTAVQAKVEHQYTCTSHTRLIYEKEGDGPWVLTDKVVDQFPNTCEGSGKDVTSWKEEGM
jgi:hypothetical protein